MAFPIKIPSMSASSHGFSISPLANKAGTLISSPGSIVDHTNHNRRRHWIDENIVFMGTGTGLRQVFGFCAITSASAHSLPIRITAFSQRDSLRGAGPWSQHISLMPRSVDCSWLPLYPGIVACQIDRQTDLQAHTHTHLHTQSLLSLYCSSQIKVASSESCLLPFSVAANWHQMWTTVSCGKDVIFPACC